MLKLAVICCVLVATHAQRMPGPSRPPTPSPGGDDMCPQQGRGGGGGDFMAEMSKFFEVMRGMKEMTGMMMGLGGGPGDGDRRSGDDQRGGDPRMGGGDPRMGGGDQRRDDDYPGRDGDYPRMMDGGRDPYMANQKPRMQPPPPPPPPQRKDDDEKEMEEDMEWKHGPPQILCNLQAKNRSHTLPRWSRPDNTSECNRQNGPWNVTVIDKATWKRVNASAWFGVSTTPAPLFRVIEFQKEPHCWYETIEKNDTYKEWVKYCLPMQNCTFRTETKNGVPGVLSVHCALEKKEKPKPCMNTLDEVMVALGMKEKTGMGQDMDKPEMMGGNGMRQPGEMGREGRDGPDGRDGMMNQGGQDGPRMDGPGQYGPSMMGPKDGPDKEGSCGRDDMKAKTDPFAFTPCKVTFDNGALRSWRPCENHVACNKGPIRLNPDWNFWFCQQDTYFDLNTNSFKKNESGMILEWGDNDPKMMNYEHLPVDSHIIEEYKKKKMDMKKKEEEKMMMEEWWNDLEEKLRNKAPQLLEMVGKVVKKKMAEKFGDDMMPKQQDGGDMQPPRQQGGGDMQPPPRPQQGYGDMQRGGDMGRQPMDDYRRDMGRDPRDDDEMRRPDMGREDMGGDKGGKDDREMMEKKPEQDAMMMLRLFMQVMDLAKMQAPCQGGEMPDGDQPNPPQNGDRPPPPPRPS